MFKEIRERLDKITPGKWIDRYGEVGGYFPDSPPEYSGVMEVYTDKGDYIASVGEQGSGENNASFIASAPSDLSTLLQFADEAMELIKSGCVKNCDCCEHHCLVQDFLKRWEGK